MASRTSKVITNQNDIDEILSIKEEDMTLSFFMEMFGQFNERTRFKPYDTFTVPAGSYKLYKDKTNKKPFKTTIGLWIFNKFFLEKDFAWFTGYINHQMSGKAWESLTTKISRGCLEDKLSTDSLCNLLQKAQKIMPLSTPFTPSTSEKMLMVSQYIIPKKNELCKKYAKEIESGDAVAISKMQKELLDYALDWLGDDPALDIYLSGARSNLENHFMNMHIMKGAIRNPDPNAEKQFNIATSCFNNGFSKEEYAMLGNSLARGPYSRAKKTEIGGYWEKLIMYAYQHLTLDEPGSDCGTKDFLEIQVNEKEMNDWMYSYVLDPQTKTLEEITSDNYKKYLNKKINIRFSAYCESKTGICNKCMGNLYYRLNVRNIGITMMMIASKIKNINMKAFHDGTEKSIRFNPVEAFGE